MNSYIALDQFGFLSIRGRDAQKFFQGYCTCNLGELRDRPTLGATCNIQGNVVANFYIAKLADGLLLRLDKSLIETMEAFLAKYIVFSKAELQNVSHVYQCYGIINTESPAAADGEFCFDVAAGRYEYWTQTPVTENLTADASAWLDAEIESGHAWLNLAATEQYLPQSLNLDELDGIDFEKGCYLGQEIVARMHFRGNLKKLLHIGQADTDVKVGQEIQNSEGKNLGSVVYAHRNRFLAVVQTKSIKAEDAALNIDSNTVQIKSLRKQTSE